MQTQYENLQDECQAYINALISAIPRKKMPEIRRAQTEDATCQNIQVFGMHESPDKAKMGFEEKLYM